jgi:hypothetical protein
MPVLYIFHTFHKSLNGPLAVSFGINFVATSIFFCQLINVLQDDFLGVRWLCAFLQVLYRFLGYYCKFDGDNKGIILFVPYSLSSLHNVASE